MNKTFAIIALCAAGLATPALAAGAGDGSNASSSGATHGAFADTNGNFGFLGSAGGTPGYHNGAVGQDPGATGYNNSHVTTPPTSTGGSNPPGKQ
ncbi:MAG: hypothetical protein K8H90_06620 [Thermoanaerobaculia bacterium]|nr:hypothetical protein [Thermoanaerobaculia bacterium]